MNRAAAIVAALALWGCQNDATAPQGRQAGMEARPAVERAVVARKQPSMASPARTGPAAAQLHLSCPRACAGVTRFDAMIEDSARRAGLGACAWKAQLCRESSMRPGVCSEADACGLAQLLPGTAQDLGVTDRFDPAQSVKAGARYEAWTERQWARYGRTRCEIKANGRASYPDGVGRLLDCQRERGGFHLREWEGCVSNRAMTYARDIARMADEPDCIGSPS